MATYQSRRLLVYVFVDCCQVGDSRVSPSEMMDQVLRELCGDPQSIESVCLSVIGAGSALECVAPLLEVLDVREAKQWMACPSIKGPLNLDAVVGFMEDVVQQQYRPSTQLSRGDFGVATILLLRKPIRPSIAFVDRWRALQKRFRRVVSPLVCVAGAGAAQGLWGTMNASCEFSYEREDKGRYVQWLRQQFWFVDDGPVRSEPVTMPTTAVPVAVPTGSAPPRPEVKPMPTYNRRLPIYLILDISESMAGEPYDAVQGGLASMMSELRGNPMALETAAIRLITFASQAQQVVPLTDILKFQLPRLKMGSGTALGAALTVLMQAMDREIVKTSPTQKGDYKPIVFLMTDGTPTDKWEPQADTIKNTIVGKRANVIGVACGADADVAMLNRITPTIVRLKGMEGGSFKQFFKWVSASVSSASQKLNAAGDAPVGLPEMPKEMEVAAASEKAAPPDPDKFVFLHAKCSKTRQFYIARYIKAGSEKAGWFKTRLVYNPVGAYRVDDFDLGDGKGPGITVPVESLQGIPPCPCCGGPGLALCEKCGKLSCVYSNTPTCGWCGFSGALGSASGGSVGRGRG